MVQSHTHQEPSTPALLLEVPGEAFGKCGDCEGLDDGTKSKLEFVCGPYYNSQSGRNSSTKNRYSELVKPTCVLYHEVIEGGNPLSSHVRAENEEDSGHSAGAIA
jgi:hypothetical protein